MFGEELFFFGILDSNFGLFFCFVRSEIWIPLEGIVDFPPFAGDVPCGFRIPFEGPVRDLRKWAQKNRNQVIGDITSSTWFISAQLLTHLFSVMERGGIFSSIYWRLGPGHLVQLVYYFQKVSRSALKGPEKNEKHTPLKINSWNIIPWRFCSDHDFLSFHEWFVGEPAVNRSRAVNMTQGHPTTFMILGVS